MKPFSKCPQCGLFEDRRTTCACGYAAPAEPLPPPVPPPDDSLPVEPSGITSRFVALSMIRLAIPFAIAVAAVEFLTAPVSGVQWKWMALCTATGFVGGALIGLALAVVRGPAVPDVAADPAPPVRAGAPPTERPILLWLIGLPAAGYLGGTTRRFDENEVIAVLESRYPVIGLVTGVGLSLLALLPEKSKKTPAQAVQSDDESKQTAGDIPQQFPDRR